MTDKDPSAIPARNKTLPYDAVNSVCVEIGTLAQAIESACVSMNMGGEENPIFQADQVMWMAANAARTIGHMADHLTGYDMRGPNQWLGLPNIEQSGGES